MPAVQIAQGPPSGPLDPLLHVHSLRAWLPDGDDDREGQLEHVLDVVAPEIVEYVPPAQRAQEAEPGEILYVPAVQLVQDPPSGPDQQALQVQAVAMRLPTGELEFDGQASHVAAPGLGLKVPAPHDVHVPPSGPEEPALHTHCVILSLPAGEWDLLGHASQSSKAEYFPALHSSQTPSSPL